MKLYVRGMHHDSIFSYNIKSHRIMNYIIDKVFKVIEDFSQKVSLSCACRATFPKYPDEFEEAYMCLDRCEEYMYEVQNELVHVVEKTLEKVINEVKDPEIVLRVINLCETRNRCFINVLLFYTRNDNILHVLLTNFDLSIDVDPPMKVFIEPILRTAIIVPEVPVELSCVNKLTEKLSTFTPPDNPEEETSTEVNFT